MNVKCHQKYGAKEAFHYQLDFLNLELLLCSLLGAPSSMYPQTAIFKVVTAWEVSGVTGERALMQFIQ